MVALSVLCCVICADRTPEQKALLKTFREEFVAITPGQEKFPASFTMGRDADNTTERPAHEVRLTKPFYMAKYEVPQNLWREVMGKNPSRWRKDRNSVEMLSFDEAVDFCRQTTDLMRAAGLIEAGQVIRLPSEAEWEYCCRAGTTTVYSFGDTERDISDFAWFTGNAAGNDPAVGEKKSNAWGLYDMHGYLWEWCSDPWHDNYDGAPRYGSSWTKDGDAGRRVLRSGSWKDKADRLTSSYRQAAKVNTRDDAVGLRCVLASEK